MMFGPSFFSFRENVEKLKCWSDFFGVQYCFNNMWLSNGNVLHVPCFGQPQSHQSCDHVTTLVRPRNKTNLTIIVEITCDWSQRSWMINISKFSRQKDQRSYSYPGTAISNHSCVFESSWDPVWQGFYNSSLCDVDITAFRIVWSRVVMLWTCLYCRPNIWWTFMFCSLWKPDTQFVQIVATFIFYYCILYDKWHGFRVPVSAGLIAFPQVKPGDTLTSQITEDRLQRRCCVKKWFTQIPQTDYNIEHTAAWKKWSSSKDV